MKAILILSALAGHALAAQPLVARIKPAELARLQQADPMIRLQSPAEGEAKVGRPAGQSIINQSTVLHDGTRWTIIPDGAVLFVPEQMKARVGAEPSGQLLGWTEFLTANRGWLTTCEVSFDQATGKESLPAERCGFWAKQDKIVVAVHQRGPISFRGNKTPNTPQP
ncbi:MAG: hypothetical protein EHM17_07365 [Verrucomicrobiaceae bacterium]|nr:MAG: hypothetical protein EHM17_07365 [Verrucomicrobiaceae bacterium]